MSKNRILFFARDYQLDLFARLSDLLDGVDCFYFTMLKSEQLALKSRYNNEKIIEKHQNSFPA